jgi:hypothetical protein
VENQTALPTRVIAQQIVQTAPATQAVNAERKIAFATLPQTHTSNNSDRRSAAAD